jgi:glycine/D-amino acid oxidase-like deaminating enzyme
VGTTVRRITGTGGGRIVIRNCFTYDPSMEVDAARLAAVAKDHDRSFARSFPLLAGVAMKHPWGGRLCLSRNGAPAFGEVEPGLYAACCENGLGMVKGTLSGMLAAELAIGERSGALADMLAEPTPSRLPPEPFAFIGANAVIRWRERAAGDEL